MTEFSMELSEDQLQIQKWVHDFAEDVIRPAGQEWDEKEEFPFPIVQQAAEIGLYGWEFMAEAMFNDPTGLTMVLALDAVQRGNMKLGRVWLLATAVLGSMFLAGQYIEFSHFYHEGLGLSTNLFGSSFYLLTGTHGAHVTVGVVWLMTLFFMASRGKLSEEDSLTVEIAGLYWHFVDVVWIVLFTLIYLLG